MKRRDEEKTSLVDFMRSIKFSDHKSGRQSGEVSNHFAHLSSHVRPAGPTTAEDKKLVRSGN